MSSAWERRDCGGGFPRVIDAIPPEELKESSLDALERRYMPVGQKFAVWYEYVVPDELDLIFPTTDAKLNYLSFTRRLASAIHRGLTATNTNAHANCPPGLHGRASGDADGRLGAREVCEHVEALRGRSDRFASVIDRFLDLHQILREA